MRLVPVVPPQNKSAKQVPHLIEQFARRTFCELPRSAGSLHFKPLFVLRVSPSEDDQPQKVLCLSISYTWLSRKKRGLSLTGQAGLTLIHSVARKTKARDAAQPHYSNMRDQTHIRDGKTKLVTIFLQHRPCPEQ